MNVLWNWMLPVGAGLAIVVILGAMWRQLRRRAGHRDDVRVANTSRLSALPRYRSLARTHRRSLASMTGAALALVVASVVLAARPVRSETVEPSIANRDIMLCLDVSGSMAEYNRSVLEQFSQLLDRFDGERVGLTIFNSSAVTVFPLTTDYRFVLAEFDRFRLTFAERGIDTLDGTLEGDGSSLVPDGIASCALAFPEDAGDRSRSIVVATDNEIEGSTLLAIEEVSTIVTDRSIHVHAIFPLFDYEDPDRKEAAEIRQLTQRSAGSFNRLEDTTGTASIVADIERTQAAALDAEARLVEVAQPHWWIAVAAVALIVLLVVARRARL